MLSDDEFLEAVLPLLRAKRAAQGRESDSLYGSSGHLSSPKNDPNGHTRSGLWFPVVVSQRAKYGHIAKVEVMGTAEAVSADLSRPLDGRIRLEHSVMNCNAERVTLLTTERKRLVGLKDVRGQRVKYEKDVLRVHLKGLDVQPVRFYTIDFPYTSKDHQTQTLMRGWEARHQAREKYREELETEYMKLPRVSLEELKKLNTGLDVEELKKNVEAADRFLGKPRKLR